LSEENRIRNVGQKMKCVWPTVLYLKKPGASLVSRDLVSSDSHPFRVLIDRKFKHSREAETVATRWLILQGDQKVSVHLMNTIQKSGAQRLFDHSV